MDELPLRDVLLLRGRDRLGYWITRIAPIVASTDGIGRLGAYSWALPDGALFEPTVIVAELAPRAAASEELKPLGQTLVLHPDQEALRLPARLRVLVGDRPSRDAGLYRDGGDGWEFVRADYDSALQGFEGETRRFGRFSLFRDVRAPQISRFKPPRVAATGPYSRWALEARLADRGSGVEARASWFVVDGARVPSEWDAEQGILRWRPLVPPERGGHRYTVVAGDRAGNVARSGGTFVLD
jgi:hypothetical protein